MGQGEKKLFNLFFYVWKLQGEKNVFIFFLSPCESEKEKKKLKRKQDFFLQVTRNRLA